MKNKTLHRQIEKVSGQISRTHISIEHWEYGGRGLRKRVEQAKQEELDNVKKSLIERFAEKYQGVADVINGDATFYSYGEPIIEHVRRVEDEYQSKKLGFISRKTLLGEGRKFATSDKAREAVQYLRDEQIIDYKNFFSSRLIHPAAGIVSKMHKNPQKTVEIYALVGLTIGAPIGAYLSYHQTGEAEYSFFGGIIGLGLPMLSVVTISLLGEGLAKISRQRETFEKALQNLDSDVRKYFPLEVKDE